VKCPKTWSRKGTREKNILINVTKHGKTVRVGDAIATGARTGLADLGSLKSTHARVGQWGEKLRSPEKKTTIAVYFKFISKQERLIYWNSERGREKFDGTERTISVTKGKRQG